MGKKILDSKALYIFLSVVIAIALWFYVTSLDGNEDTQTINNIPITFVGAENLERQGLMIVGNTPTASVRVKAAPMVLAKLNSDNIKLTVNVSTIEEAAQYTMAYTASLPSGVSSSQVQFVSGATGNVSFTVARYSTREVELRGEFVGTVAEGFLPGAADEFIFSPGKLTISGQAELVNQVAYAKVVIDGTELTESVSGDYPYQLIGASGDVLEGLDIECESETVYVTYPILATAEIPLTVKFIPGGGVSEQTMTYKLSADSITVAGSKDAVSAIQKDGSLTITTVDLATVHDGDVISCTIPLADELTNISGITEVTVTIRLSSSLHSKTIEATKIEYINLPEGWNASIVTKVLAVEVRGSAELLKDITEENVRVAVDLKDINLVAGQYTVAADVYLDSVGSADQIGVVGTDYKVVVTISQH